MKLAEANRTLKAALEDLARSRKKFADALSKTPISFNRKAALDCLANSPRLFVAYCALIRLLKAERDFFAAETFVLIIRIPQSWSLDDFEYLSEVCFGALTKQPNLVLNVFCHPSRGKKGHWDFQPQKQLPFRKVIVFAPTGGEIHPEFAAAADKIVDLKVSDERYFSGLSRLLRSGPLPFDDISFLSQQDAPFIDAVFRRARPAAPAIQRLRQVVSKAKHARTPLPLISFGEAGSWGLRLKADLDAWRKGVLPWTEIDKGVLLYGSPGVGKTSFAVALAAECNVQLVAASLAKWQSGGHLGDLLRAMYADFAEAKANTPSILLIDEFDAFGDRAKLSGDNAQYVVEVINAALEAIDGATGREGVVIIGATNLPERIDPAFLRAGRLEKHIHIGKPNSSARAEILSYYLPELTGDLALSQVARRLPGRTGADLEYMARRARQRARLERRSPTISDLREELPKDPSLSADDEWRVCLHEAGHAILAKLFDVGTVESVEVFDLHHSDEESDNSHGRTSISLPQVSIRTENSFRADIAMQLGGMIAEELILGDRSTTAGGSPDSDLAGATALAVKMVSMFGMGRSLHIVPKPFGDSSLPDLFTRLPGLRFEVDRILQTEFARAKTALESNQDALLHLANALKSERKLTGERLAAFLDPLVGSTPTSNTSLPAVRL
ncbi:AAA family ATPase [Neorhizobium tomejilense]|uniref:AAA family ATPase n=1 Tax=Neorhizobium tomejilense TaxID=2093828 RepID=UPI000CF8A6A0|nr:AAA family ATPase [Neorhizobium tomejilense]